jgi:hypothetical protein
MYAKYILGDIQAPPYATGARFELDNLPQGLQGYYQQFWTALEPTAQHLRADWNRLDRPIIERLAVAAEAVTVEWLGEQIGQAYKDVREALERWRRLIATEQIGESATWRIAHRSFSEFLADKVDLHSAHRSVAEHYTNRLASRWNEWDNYGLRYAPMHLSAAATDPGSRYEMTVKLISLLLDRQYKKERLERLRDPSDFERELALTLETAAWGDAVYPPQFCALALELVAFRKEQRQAEPIFDMARHGDIDGAERRLDLFALEVDADWCRALLLIIAWLGAPNGAEKARGLRDRVRKDLEKAPASQTLQMLLQLVDASIDGTAPPVTFLPPPPSLDEARAIVAQLQHSTVDRSLLASDDFELIKRRKMIDVELMMRGEMLGGRKGYLAEIHGPQLVASTLTAPELGEFLLQQYVAVHAAYGYREYRQGSLWALLGAVLQHPKKEWVQSWASALGAAALAPNRGEFRECLGLTTLALRARAGEAGAHERLDQSHAQEVALVSEMPAIYAGASQRGQGDTWGIHRRRLSALAEVFSRLAEDPSTSKALITRALGLPYGFAGFNSPACLALAEAIEVSSPDIELTAQALAAARSSAHNIQDGTFCARTTARVNALSSRWWGTPPVGAFDVVGAAQRLAKEPSAPEFAAQHVVGETYAERVSETTTALPDQLLNATSLDQLAEIYKRPTEEFRRINSAQGWEAYHSLPPGTVVNIPDPGFAPLLASRFAARALADPSLSEKQQRATILILVPVAAADATSLDTVLSRLLLATRLQDHKMLDALAELASRSEATITPDLELRGRLTAYIP